MRGRVLALCLVLRGAKAFSSFQSRRGQGQGVLLEKRALYSTSTKPYFVSEKDTSGVNSNENSNRELQKRKLGSQEHLMLPRQYSIGPETFPQMSHVSCTVLNNTPDTNVLKTAIESAMRSHPMLRARISGTGEECLKLFLFNFIINHVTFGQESLANELTCFRWYAVVSLTH